MKAIFVIGLSVLLTQTAFARGGAVSVSGYYRSNGTYVAPYTRSAPDGTATDNYSYSGNENPYTGKVGKSKKLDKHDISGYNSPSPTQSIPVQNSPQFVPYNSNGVHINNDVLNSQSPKALPKKFAVYPVNGSLELK